MSGPSLLATGGALALVLGLLFVSAHVIRRWAPRGLVAGGSRAGARGDAGRIEVLSRAGLSPRQGLATVRVAGRTALVSFGEGGVRLVMELDGAAERHRVDVTVDDASGADAPDEASDRSRFQSALARAARKVPALRALVLGLVLVVAVPRAGGAAQAPSAPPAASVRSASADSAALRRDATRARALENALSGGGLPDMRVAVGDAEQGGVELSGPVGTVLFVGFLTLLPTLLLLMTGFTRILIVLHLLKQALGTQTAPPAHLLAAMALMLTGFVMAPTFEQANDRALAPWMAGEMDSATMLKEASVPFREFMLHSTREQDLAQFVEMSGKPAPETAEEIPIVTLTSAFVTSELTSAFQMGFALFLPFLVIDLVVASVLMSMGMFMLPPVMVSLPFKLLLFVLVDGWSLVVGSLVRSFA